MRVYKRCQRLRAAALGAAVSIASTAHSQDLLIEHVTIVSPQRPEPLRDMSVYIHSGRIAAMLRGQDRKHASAALLIDGSGQYLAPGLIDSHVHLGDIPGMTQEQEREHADIALAARRQFPRSYLHYGFTTLIDLNSQPQAMQVWSRNDLRPDTYFCGGAIYMDGYPMNFAPKPERYEAPYFLIDAANSSAMPDGIDAAQHTAPAVLRHMHKDGALCLKTFYETGFGPTRNLPVPQLSTMRELVAAAHAAAMPVFMHANSSTAQTFALDAGVDVVAHGLWNWNEANVTTDLTAAQREILDRVIASNTGYQPTIQVLYGEHDLMDPQFLSRTDLPLALPESLIAWYRSAQGQWFHDAMASNLGLKAGDPVPDVDRVAIRRVNNVVSYLNAHHARLLFGSDTPSAPTYANPPGLNGYIELHRLVAAGMTPREVFCAATLSNAHALGLEKEIGTIEVGKQANLLLLREDPSQTVDAFGSVIKIILHGRVLDAADLAANAPAGVRP